MKKTTKSNQKCPVIVCRDTVQAMHRLHVQDEAFWGDYVGPYEHGTPVTRWIYLEFMGKNEHEWACIDWDYDFNRYLAFKGEDK